MRHFARIFLITALCYVALGALSANAQTFTYDRNGGFTTPGSPTFDGIPLIDAAGDQTTIWISEGNNAYTGKPYSWLLFTSGPLEGLQLAGTGYSVAPVTPHQGYPGNAFPPVCGNSCTTLTGTFSGVDPGTGRTVIATVNFNVFIYQTRFREYEIYAGTMELQK